jgi:hypothetical protein
MGWSSPALAPRGVITLAFGKQKYVEMGKSLGRSLKLNAPDLPRAVVTDSTDPELHSLYTHIVPYQAAFGPDVCQKVHLDFYSPFEETLFIDSDCLVLNNLDSFWEAFAGQYFGVPGWRVLHKGNTDPFFDVEFILDRFGLDGVPKFNGGTYYFKRGAECTRFFDRSRELLANAGDLRLGTFRGQAPADEAIFAIAMAIEGIPSTSMGTRGMWTPASSRGPIEIDVEKGWSSFEKEGRVVYPDVVHFAGTYANSFAYFRECLKLRQIFGGHQPGVTTMGKTFMRSALWECSHGARDLVKRVRG